MAKNRRHTSGPNPRTVFRNQIRRLISFGPGHRTTRKSRTRMKPETSHSSGGVAGRPEKSRPLDGAELKNHSTNQNPSQADSVGRSSCDLPICIPTCVPTGVTRTSWRLPLSGDGSRTNRPQLRENVGALSPEFAFVGAMTRCKESPLSF